MACRTSERTGSPGELENRTDLRGIGCLGPGARVGGIAIGSFLQGNISHGCHGDGPLDPPGSPSV